MTTRDGHLLKRAGTEFVGNLIWMAVVFGSLAAILAAVTDLSLVEVMAFVGVCVAVMAAIVTVVVLWSGAHEEPRPGGHADSGSPPETRGGDWPGGGWWDGGGGGDGGGWGCQCGLYTDPSPRPRRLQRAELLDSGPSSRPYSPECGEGEFSEV
jgi:hypothetical protein